MEVGSILFLLMKLPTPLIKNSFVCVCVKFVVKTDIDWYCIREEFIQFENAPDLTGAGLAQQLLSILRKHGINPLHCVGQGYDGAKAMSGHLNGVQANFRKEAPHAVYVHCSSHALNLVLRKRLFGGTLPANKKLFAGTPAVLYLCFSTFQPENYLLFHHGI